MSTIADPLFGIPVAGPRKVYVEAEVWDKATIRLKYALEGIFDDVQVTVRDGVALDHVSLEFGEVTVME